MVTIPNPCEGWPLSRNKDRMGKRSRGRLTNTARRISMNSFKVTAIGRVAQPLELKGAGESQYVKVTLIGNDYAGKDSKGNAREVITTVYFTAFGSMAKTLAQN